MASYRSPYANYMSDKSGNHSPVGSILPVFVDTNMAGNDPKIEFDFWNGEKGFLKFSRSRQY